MSIRQDVLEAQLVQKLRDALTPDMVDYLVSATNRALSGPHREVPQDVEPLIEERRRVERELANLVEFVLKGDVSSPRLREEIEAREERPAQLDQELERLRGRGRQAPVQIGRAWVEKRLQTLKDLLAKDPLGARRELQKRIDDLRIGPVPETGDRVVRVSGTGKIGSLLGAEEAVRLQLVAGAGFEPATFGL